MTSRPIVGNMFAKWVISASVGTRRPTFSRSARPVNSSTHSRITDGARSAVGGAMSLFLGLAACLGVLAVVMTSSFRPVPSLLRSVWASSGSARFDRRGGRREPIKGFNTRSDRRMIDNGSRYELRPARSERYICPDTMPINATTKELGSLLMASCKNKSKRACKISRESEKKYL